MPAADTQLAAQLFTLRDFCKTPADMAKTFRRLSDQGWRAVQVSAIGEIAPRELRKLLDDNGLACCVTHRPLQRLAESVAETVEEHEILGCRYTAIGGYFPKSEGFSRDTWQAFIREYNAAAERYAGRPLALGYHNHSHELAKVGGQTDLKSPTAMEMLAEGLSQEVWFEIDTYWIAHGGGDPAAWIRRFKGRVPCIHLKDLAILPDRTQYMAEVGVGNLNWPDILDAARESGVEWYIVEQDTCYRDPFDSLKTSLENLQAMGLK